MADTGRDTVIFLERDRLYLYNGGAILSLNFPANLSYDMDVKDRDAFFNLVTTFIQTNKLEASQIFFVISEAACFSKDFPIKNPTDTSEVEDASQGFIDAVPFNSVLSKIYKTQAIYRVVATNLDLIDTIVDAFTGKGFGLTALVPANIYPEYGASRELTADFAKHVINTRDITKMSSMVGEKVAQEDHEVSTSTAKEPRSKLLPFLIIGFAILLIILLVVIFLRR